VLQKTDDERGDDDDDDDDETGCTLFVKNLNLRTTEETLKEVSFRIERHCKTLLITSASRPCHAAFA